MNKGMKRQLKTGLRLLFFGLLLFNLAVPPLFAETDDPESVLGPLTSYWKDHEDQGTVIAATEQPLLPVERLAKARPDECFFGILDPENPVAPPLPANVYDPEQTMACDHNKVNQAYVWGMVKSGDNIWFGTGANVNCLVQSFYLGLSDYELDNEAYVCEFGNSQYLKDLIAGLPDLVDTGSIDISELPMDIIGDWRPSKIYVYNTLTKTLTDKTPLSNPLFSYPETLMNATFGIRSAGTLGNVVILAGPSALGGIDLYAFNANSGDYLGSTNLNALPGEEDITVINNIRKWLTVDGVLYTIVGVTYADDSTGGKVLRWTGSAETPFEFAVVGTLDSAGAELALHEGRLFVSTWAGGGEIGAPSENNNPAGIFMSPVIPPGGLTASTDDWTKVWSVTDYEPDPVMAATYGGGALVSFDGYLFWGTMHVPELGYVSLLRYISEQAGSSRQVWFQDAGTREEHYAYSADIYRAKRSALRILASQRAISIFRGQNMGQINEKIDMVYGQKTLPVFTLTTDDVPHDEEIDLEGYVARQEITHIAKFDLVPNKMAPDGADPLRGPSGFGNAYNNYTWTMRVFDHQLYVGTMNSTMLLEALIPTSLYQSCSRGANLFRFANADAPAIPEHLDGVGNDTNYGIRTMVSDDALYLGTANPMNMAQDDQGKNIGGWELIKIGDWMAVANGAGKIQMSVSASAGTPFIENITTMAADDPDINQRGKPTDQEFPDGLVSFTVKNLANVGDTVRVTFTLPSNYPADAKYYKVTDAGFEEFLNPNDNTPLYEFSDNTVTLTLTDGDQWDGDGETNGEISDPGGPAKASTASASSSGGGCFFSTLF